MKKFTETTHDHPPYPSERLAAIGLAAAVLAHEIANELNVVGCAVQVAEEELTKQNEKDDVVSVLHEAKNGIERLCSLLEQFRKLGTTSKAEASANGPGLCG